jgi:hypothetical protein
LNQAPQVRPDQRCHPSRSTSHVRCAIPTTQQARLVLRHLIIRACPGYGSSEPHSRSIHICSCPHFDARIPYLFCKTTLRY